METLRLCICQIDLAWEQAELNRRGIEQILLDQIVEPCDLILLPEMFTTGFSMRSADLAEDATGLTLPWMQELALRHQAAIAGSIIFNEAGNFYNRFWVVTPDGSKPRHYDKRHLFRLAGEEKHYAPGHQKLVMEFRGWQIAFFICYDLRFPVWCRNREGADLMVFSANWPQKRALAWNSLLPARAIENQCYVAGINRTGCDGLGIEYGGNSAVYDFEGNVLVQLDANPHIAFVTLEKRAKEVFRRAYPFWKDGDRFEVDPTSTIFEEAKEGNTNRLIG